MIRREQVIPIGTFAKPFGTQGQLLCRTTNAYWQGGEFVILSINNLLVPFRVTEFSFHGEDILFALKDIDTEAKARALTGCNVYMLRTDVSTEAEDEMLWTDFIGWKVIDTEQGALGTIIDIDDSTENILATLSNDKLIPLHEDFINQMDEQNHVLTITLPFIVE